MSGPNSAPNGDRSLISGDRNYCIQHADKIQNCTKDCKPLRKREWLAAKGKLFTGKTR